MIAIGTDFDGMMTQGWKQPQPPHLIAINVDAADASKNYLPDVADRGRRRRGRRARSPTGSRSAAASTRSRSACAS